MKDIYIKILISDQHKCLFFWRRQWRKQINKLASKINIKTRIKLLRSLER